MSMKNTTHIYAFNKWNYIILKSIQMKNIYNIDLPSYKMTEIKGRENTYKIE